MSAPAPGIAADLLAELHALGIQLEAVGERLRFRPREKVTADLAARLKAHKAGLLAILQRPQDATPATRPTVEAAQPNPPPAGMPDVWFTPGASTPSRQCFAYHPETKTRPDWWGYLYEVHNRGLAVVDGKIVPER